MPPLIRRVFLEHPYSVEESYAEHARFAAGFSARLFLAAGAAAIHAAIPCCFEKTASRMVAELNARTADRGR